MQTPRGVNIEQKVQKLKDRFENYMHSLVDEWIRVIPGIIQDKIMNPLFTVYSDNTIGLNFANEVIIILFLNK